ncbi:ARM repeat-containing protein [Auricularia subglabra TFB-10046 SS5]|nr:ARM repeat-containing protein [Auricularia subglabra TFB-10046 SS5]
MPYIPLFQPALGPGPQPPPPLPLPQEQQLPPSLASSTSSLRQSASGSSIWAPQPLSPPGLQWPDAQPLVSKSQALEGELGYSKRPTAGAIGDGRTKTVIERSQMAVVEQLLRSLHLDSPAPTPAPPPLQPVPRRYSPGPLSASSASSPSALATPDNLSPSLPPDAIDYYPFPHNAPSPTHDSQTASFGFNGLKPAAMNSPPSAAEIFARSARSQSLSSIAPIQSFNPFSIPLSPQQPHSMLRAQPAMLDVGRAPYRHASMPDARARGDWIPTDLQPLSPPPLQLHHHQQAPSLANPFSISAGAGNHHAIGRMDAPAGQAPLGLNQSEPINFLRLLQPSSQPPYDLFVHRIVKLSDQQASIFLQQKLKVADGQERMRIVDAIAAKGFEMMTNRFGNWAVQRCLENPHDPEERRKLVACMRGRVVDLATNCYGTHVLQKALDCDDEIRIMIVSELLLKDPASTLVNKHASHVFSKIMELTWSDPAPPIFAYFNNALRGKWASLACHETGSLVVQHVFENIEDDAQEEIIGELMASFSEVVKNQWGSFCVQHLLEHGSPRHRDLALNCILDNFLEYATHEQGIKSIQKALKEGGPEALDKICTRLGESQKGGRRAILVDLALNPLGSQLIANILPSVNKEQRTMLYDAIKRHVVTLRGSKTGSKTVWLFDRMRAYYGYPGQ